MMVLVVLALFILALYHVLLYCGIFSERKVSIETFAKFFIGLYFILIFISFFIKFHPMDDITKYYTHIDNFRKNGIEYYFSTSYPYKLNLLTSTLFFMVSLTPFNVILPIFSVAFFYGTILYLIYLEKNNELDVSTICVYLLLVFTILYFKTIFSSIRFAIAISLFAIILNNENKVNKFIYLLLPLIHTYTFILILLRILISLFKKYINKLKYIVMLFPYIAILFIRIININKDVPILGDIWFRISVYLSSNILDFSQIDFRLYLIYLILYIILIVLFKIKHSDDIYCLFYKIILSLLFGLIPFPVVFERFFYVLILLSLPFIKNYKLLPFKVKTTYKIIILVSTLCLGIFRLWHILVFWRI